MPSVSAFLCVPTSPHPVRVPLRSRLVRACRPVCADPEQGLGLQTPPDSCVAVMSTSAPLRELVTARSLHGNPPSPAHDSKPLPGVLTFSLSSGTPVPLGEGLAPNGHPHPVFLGLGVRLSRAPRAHRPSQWVKPRPGHRPVLDLEASRQDVATRM
ncbi:unnamed protein product [Rangifer tarandus platyrhynchus]|uniref:Uncharacterized protein n=2 Tax=Rangifer tarandus platyrhynchus TaxID=3082113 RepID=A0ABN8ZF22_RANTA|nr:unnamed protein product [Rangifer tarandus platyrhynchus]CAI9707599.1 unnamed protein product [Rangifer tarandus platyrhynchus]